MKAKFDGYNWLARLERGEKLVESLDRLIIEQDIKTAWLFGIGAASSAEVGYYDLKNKDYVWKKVDKDLEILSLQGNLTLGEDKPLIHLHGLFSDESGKTFGGHVKDLTVSITCELFLHNWFAGQGITRFIDPDTGLKLLDL